MMIRTILIAGICSYIGLMQGQALEAASMVEQRIEIKKERESLRKLAKQQDHLFLWKMGQMRLWKNQRLANMR